MGVEGRKELGRRKMHIVMVPWLAMGHIIPFHHLSISLARRGHRVSFLSTPRNLRRLPPTPETLAHLVTLVPLPLHHPPDSPLPPHAESSLDISYPKHQLLKHAFDSIEPAIASFLAASSPPPDWIISDFATHWLPALGRQLGIRSAYFCLFYAALVAFFGPPSALLDGGDLDGFTIEDFTATPPWVPFQSDIKFRPHELAKYVQRSDEYRSVTYPDTVRFGVILRDVDFMAIRTSPDFEPEWLDLLGKIYQKPIVPVGFLPPALAEYDAKDEERWISMREWLDKQAPSSMVYVALGSEVELDLIEVRELALGLEKTGLPFFWVLRDPPESTRSAREMLPDGFEERVAGRGMVCSEWAPQVRILSHGSVRGFLTHCGCNSVVEGLMFGRVLIMLPMINDQGLNARMVHSKKLGVEVERNEGDGSFTADSVAEAVTVAMVGKAGEPFRASAREAMGLFGNRERNDSYVDEFVSYLEEHRKGREE